MTIAPYPIYARDITALSTPSSPVSVETRRSTRSARPLASGWLTSAVIQPGFEVFAAQYETHKAYEINTQVPAGFHINLNMGDGDSAGIPKRELYLASGHFGTMSLNEPLPIKLHRGERRHQERCGIWLQPEWFETGIFERIDDTGLVARTVAQRGISDVVRASPALLTASSNLFAAFNFTGPLSGLRLEAAALAFFAEAFAGAAEVRQPRPPSRFEIGRIVRLKEMLDNLEPHVDVRLVELAAHHGMSVRSLCRHFRLTFGTTVSKYVAERRIENARVALERDGIPIDHAAHVAGFAHTPNFSAAFSRRYGYPPSIAKSRARGRRAIRKSEG